MLENRPGDEANSPDAESTTSDDGNPSIEIVNLFLRTDNGMEYGLHGGCCEACTLGIVVIIAVYVKSITQIIEFLRRESRTFAA